MNKNNKEVLKSTGKIIKARRKELGFSESKLAEMIGKSQRSIRAYENGENNIPFSVLVNICKALDMDVMLLRCDSD